MGPGFVPGGRSRWILVRVAEQDVELVRQALEAFRGGDLDEMLSFLDPEIELHSAIVSGAEGNVYRGHDGYRSWYRDSFESFATLDNEWTEFRAVGDDRVLALGRVRAKGRESGVEIDSEIGFVFTVRGGKAVKAEGFLSREGALAAAGLAE